MQHENKESNAEQTQHHRKNKKQKGNATNIKSMQRDVKQIITKQNNADQNNATKTKQCKTNQC